LSQEVIVVEPKYRRPAKVWRLVSIVFAAVAMILALLFIFHWNPFGFVLVDTTYYYLLVAAFLPLCFIWVPIRNKASRERVPWYDVVLVVLSVAAPMYFVANEYEVLALGWAMGAPPVPLTFSVILWVLMVEAGRRAAGPIFAIVILFFSVYPLFGSHMPGLLWSPSFSFKHLASFHALSEESIMGIPVHVFGRLFFGYMVFAIVLQNLGAGKFFNDMAMALVGKTRAGNAKVAIIASGLFGSISGAPIANVMTTGAFTIPAMKKEGLPAHFAGAVEATASAGGALMPPVMGATAFIMAEFLEIPYAEIAIAAAVPSILYYMCLFAQIDSYAARIKLKAPILTVEIPSVWRTLISNLHIILSFLVLILLLFLLRLAAQGPWIAMALGIGLALYRKESRINLKRIINMLEETAKILGELMGIMGPVGMIIGSFIITGIAYSLPYEIVDLAGGNVALMLFLGAMASFILGMGVTISACYIFLAIVLAPGLVAAGFDLLATHLFVLYCGMMSYITPPVALTAFAAATISGADPMKTGFQAMKMGGAIYILPFVFILSPALILRAPPSELLLVIPSATVALILIAGALEGYFWRVGSLTMAMRVLLFGAGGLLAVPTVTTDFYGIGLFVVIIGLALLLRGRSPLAKILIHETKPKTEF